ncbi:NAD-glutamate dehydrogenase domain-containing protein [Mycobacterium sp.]|uniref:NAD-glutamate dehydrogenase domain-containing protein n=1 Tax=Mycobacterium sp. TaxID=1785 RepID=UPI003C73D2C1
MTTPNISPTRPCVDTPVDRAASRGLDLLGHDAVHPRMVFLPETAETDAVDALVLWPHEPPLLTDVAIEFERFGLRLADHAPLPPSEAIGPHASLHRFRFRKPRCAWTSRVKALITETFEAGHDGRFSIDRYCALTTSAGLPWRDIVLVRGMCRFIRQTELGFSEGYLIDALVWHHDFATALVQLFNARFDPQIDDRAPLVDDLRARLHGLLEDACTLDEDRALRALLGFVDAAVRTNWFQTDDAGGPKPYAAFKLDSAKLSDPGAITPFREIFVCGDDMEGIHARSGPLARGGLRFSDRPESYRTEVLQLLKTQIIKNAPIVPEGAKGAFVLRSGSVNRTDGYTTFIRGLLDVTDNRVGGKPKPPPDTVSYGEPDTYLVVAADKGTAGMSDTANSVAAQHSFWLGDAFASGGSTGYDHKAMGITARGAWVAVTRHFAELGVDVATEPVTVVGVGDMSGDVFGNGMLLSPSIRLVAAFDHRHIFVDPDPDPVRSFAERQRLFRLERPSSWNDYRREAMSDGGGVWSRTAKHIEPTPEIRTLLDIDADRLTPVELIKAILRAPVDLLWNGGIGTYVKASTETHSQAADPANDAVRVNADELCCRVVGEGGNLGFTQRARVEYALNGGRINGDFIDNAAGVATSDREVNLKIALEPAVTAGDLSLAERNRLLAECADWTADSVLADCANQTLAISLAESRAPALINRHERLVGNLEQHNGLDRGSAVLPARKELAARTATGRGLTRPEIAMLLAHSKNVVRDELLVSDVPDSCGFAGVLTDYFPDAVRRRCPEGVSRHRLAREIIATEVADRLINHVGPGLIHQLEERLGVDAPRVATAYAVVRAVLRVDELWHHATALRNEMPNANSQHLQVVQGLIEKATSWILRNRPHPLDPVAEIARYAEPVGRLLDGYPVFGPDGAPSPQLLLLGESFGLADISAERGLPIMRVAEAYLDVARDIDMLWALDTLERSTAADYWESMAAAAVCDELAAKLNSLINMVLAQSDSTVSVAEAVSQWRERHRGALSRLRRMVAESRTDGVMDLAHARTINAELGRIGATTVDSRGRPAI